MIYNSSIKHYNIQTTYKQICILKETNVFEVHRWLLVCKFQVTWIRVGNLWLIGKYPIQVTWIAEKLVLDCPSHPGQQHVLLWSSFWFRNLWVVLVHLGMVLTAASPSLALHLFILCCPRSLVIQLTSMECHTASEHKLHLDLSNQSQLFFLAMLLFQLWWSREKPDRDYMNITSQLHETFPPMLIQASLHSDGWRCFYCIFSWAIWMTLWP